MASHHPHFSGGYGEDRGDPGEFVADDLTQGLNEWRNIQDIVRLSFVAFHKALQAQGDAIQALTEQTELRALKSDVRAAFETHEELLRVRLGEAKADGVTFGNDETNATTDALEEKVAALETRLESVETRLGRFATKAELEKASEETRANLDAVLRTLQGAFSGAGDTNASATLDSNRNRTPKPERGARLSTPTAVSSGARRASLLSPPKPESLGFASLGSPDETLKLSADARDDTGTDGCGAPAHSRGSFSERAMRELKEALDSKADLSDVEKRFERKADASSVHFALERLEKDRLSYATKAELLESRRASAGAVTHQELAALASEKVGVDEVNRALAEVSAALDEKAEKSTLERFAREHHVALRGLVSESVLSVGRWIWKSGQTKRGGAVPWNVQSVNTDPQNFRWERDKTTIHAAVPGLYEVTFGFFTRKKPAIRLLVNGEPVLAAVNSASYVLHHSSGRLASATNHPAGNVTGLTLIDFLALPAKAKIAVIYDGETGAEGFISLKKL
jgi:hypothetical protein